MDEAAKNENRKLVRSNMALLDKIHAQYLFLLATTQAYILWVLISSRGEPVYPLSDVIWLLNIIAVGLTIYFIRRYYVYHRDMRWLEVRRITAQSGGNNTKKLTEAELGKLVEEMEKKIKGRWKSRDFAERMTNVAFSVSVILFFLWIVTPKFTTIPAEILSLFSR